MNALRLRRSIALFTLLFALRVLAAEDVRQGGSMEKRTAAGEFDVKMAPQDVSEKGSEASLARLSLDKHFHGELDGPSAGEMLAVRTSVEGSAAYVALETFSGTLAGRKGTFSLQHTGIMDAGVPSLTITVVPDSGTGELAGIRGTMTIDIREGKHFYRFDYELQSQPQPH